MCDSVYNLSRIMDKPIETERRWGGELIGVEFLLVRGV